MHSWGAAIDLNTVRAAYWLWPRAVAAETLPAQIIDIFERHGFIWGGKWLHYDTMHFEYRPELLNGAPLVVPAQAPPGHPEFGSLPPKPGGRGANLAAVALGPRFRGGDD